LGGRPEVIGTPFRRIFLDAFRKVAPSADRR
jgi:hypothetical protein